MKDNAMKNPDMSAFLSDVLKDVEKGDAVASYSESTPIDFDMDRLKSVEDISRFAVGLRLFRNGRVGNSYINNVDDRGFLLKSASESARFGDESDIELPGKTDLPAMKLAHDEVNAFTKEEGIKVGEEILRRLKSIDQKAKVSVSVSKNRSTFVLANTSGFSGCCEETQYGVSAGLILVEDGGGLLYVGDGDYSHDLKIDLDAVFNKIEWRYRNAQTKTSVSSGYYPVLFSPEAMRLLLETIELGANGKTLYKGISVLQDKIGQKICDERFSVTDDPLLPGGLESYSFDDEGTVPQRLPVIEKGVFRNFIFDLTNAKRMGKKSTGHASRSVASLPAPSFSNMMIAPGDKTLEEMTASIGTGLIVYEFLGGGMSNMLAGDFSVNIELGYLVENGKVKGRIKDAMLSGNVYDLLNSISMIENKAHKKGGLYCPHILFGKVSVAG
jgi:PmbA protein